MSISSEDVTTLVQAIRANAARLGLLLTRRYGTVQSMDGLVAKVLIDGDNLKADSPDSKAAQNRHLRCNSVVGHLVPGTRVVVDTMGTPPDAHFVVGVLSVTVVGEDYLTDVHSTAAATGITTETVVLTSGALVFKAGQAFLGEVGGFVTQSAGRPILRIREGTTISGTELCEFRVASDATNAPWFHGENVFVNRTASDIITALCTTLAPQPAGTASMAVANPPGLRFMRVRAIGDASNYPDYPSL